MKTCIIRPYLEAYLPASLVPVVCQFYDVVSIIPAYSLGLNVVYGRSGSGKTSLLDALKRSPTYTPTLYPSKYPGHSRVPPFGQLIYEVGLELLNATEDGCLLADEPFKVMDAANRVKYLRAMVNSGRQVVMTLSAVEIEVVRGVGGDVNLIYL